MNQANPHMAATYDQTLGAIKDSLNTYTYSGPDVQPHLQMNQANPHMATTYDQALGAIKDSLNTANPLTSLNL